MNRQPLPPNPAGRAPGAREGPPPGRIDAVQILVTALSVLALVDCAVIGWLVLNGLGS